MLERARKCNPCHSCILQVCEIGMMDGPVDHPVIFLVSRERTQLMGIFLAVTEMRFSVKVTFDFGSPFSLDHASMDNLVS